VNQPLSSNATCAGADNVRSSASAAKPDVDRDSREEGGWNSLWDAFARGVRDNMVGEVVVQTLRIGGLIFLARVLRPQDGTRFVLIVAAIGLTAPMGLVTVCGGV
jgi:hypothetical protein